MLCSAVAYSYLYLAGVERHLSQPSITTDTVMFNKSFAPQLRNGIIKGKKMLVTTEENLAGLKNKNETFNYLLLVVAMDSMFVPHSPTYIC